MIIDNIQHVMFPIAAQVEKLEKAKVDKAILFCTTPHPERARSYKELKEEMSILFKVLSGDGLQVVSLDRMKQNNQEVVQAFLLDNFKTAAIILSRRILDTKTFISLI